MKPDIVLQSDMLDILFENRNKQYGAYALRRGYDRRMILSLGGMLSLVIIFASWSYFNNNRKPDAHAVVFGVKDSVDVIICTLRPPEKPAQLPPPPKSKVPHLKQASIQYTTPVIVKVLPEAPEVPPVDKLDDPGVQIGKSTTEGSHIGTVNGSSDGVDGGTGKELVPPAPEPIKEDKPIALAEVMPQFPGGTPALIRFLSKHLRVPDGKLEAGERMRVPVKFIVSKEGKLIDIQFPENADEEYKSEIRRVLKKMPDWIPGSQHGKPVPVFFSLPVVFEVTDM